MKKFFLFSFFTFLIVILSFSKGKAQWVTIPDANFVAWLQTHYPGCMNGNLMDTTCSGIVNATFLDCNGENISDLTGVQFFNSLTYLNCSYNSLTSLPSLPNLLIQVNCKFNSLNNLPTLPEPLKYLVCNDNQLTSLPTLPDSLIQLVCSSNQLLSLPIFPNTLTDIECYSNQLISLPVLPNSLITLYCLTNQLTSLPSLPNSLTDLECGSNPMVSLPLLPDSLVHLDCYGSQLTSLPSLPNSLVDLFCGANQLTSLPTLSNSLNTLVCDGNLLTLLPELPSSLSYLNCSDNLLTELPMLPSSMIHFWIKNNSGISCMRPLLNFTGVSGSFNISNTGITCLPNYIQHSGFIPDIDTMSICDLFNANGCEVKWNISGSDYFDVDSNCVYQNSEVLIHDAKIKLYQSGNLVQQGYFGGNYSFDTDLSTYLVELDTTDFPFYVSCPNTGDTIVNVTSTDSLLFNINFALHCKPGFDIGVWDLLSDGFFPFDSSVINIFAGNIQNLYNVSCSSGISGEVKVVINGPANYVSPLAGALIPTVNGDTLTYSIADFSLVNAATDFAFNVLTDSTAQIGDAVCFDVSVTPTAGDNNISNNTLTHCFAVSNSFDPNEKEVSPIGDLNYSFNNWLTYTIHFQNTGTAPAQHIQILDTLDTDLDEGTFQLLSSSFDPMVQLFGNKVHFNFVNINLPDSGSNAEGSKGYVSYRIKPKQNLAIGTQIQNTASIYFDFNSPVVTNTTLNTIVHDDFASTISNDFQFSVYPNPVSSQLTVGSMQLVGATLIVTDIFGREVLRVKSNLNSQIINLKSFPSGIYFLKVVLEDGNFEVKKIVKE